MNTAEETKRTREIYAAAAQAINEVKLPPTEKIFQVFEAGFNKGQETPDKDTEKDLKFEGRTETVADQREFLELAIKGERDPADDGSDETPEFAVICEARANGYETGREDMVKEAEEIILEASDAETDPISEAAMTLFNQGKEAASQEMRQAVYGFFTATAENQGDPIHNPPPYTDLNQVLNAIWNLGHDQGYEEGHEGGKEVMLRKFLTIHNEMKAANDEAMGTTTHAPVFEPQGIANAIWKEGHRARTNESRNDRTPQDAAYQIFAAAFWILETHSGETAREFFKEADRAINPDLTTDKSMTPGGPRQAQEVFYETLKETEQI